MEINAEWFKGRLRELREAAGLSRQQLADKVGLSMGAVRDMEQGINQPRWATVVALCHALNCTCDAFLKEPADLPPLQAGRPKKQADEEPATKPARRKRKQK